MSNADSHYLPPWERALWALVLVAIIAIKLQGHWQPYLSNDSFQYWSVAQNADQGLIGQTSIAHFDAERSFGRLPAPMVTFPPGYALVLALLHASGLNLSDCSLVIAIAAGIASTLLLAATAARLRFSVWGTRALLAAFVTNAAVLHYAGTALTEALFSACLCAGMYALTVARSQAQGPLQPWRWILVGLIFGLSYWVRYAGLFLVLGLVLAAAASLLFDRTRRLIEGFGIALALAGALVGCGLLRNIHYVGNWRGGNGKFVHTDFSSVAVQTLRAANSLILGPEAWSVSAPWRIAALLCFVGALVLMRRVASGRHFHAVRAEAVPPVARDLLLIFLSYCAFMFYAGMTTVISYGERMFMPILPLLFVMAGILFKSMFDRDTALPAGRGVAWLLVSVSFACYAYLNVSGFLREDWSDALHAVARTMEAPDQQGGTARQAALGLAGRDGVIFANFGQATGYYFQRRTVSIVSSRFSEENWTEDVLRNEMKRYDACALILQESSPDPDAPGLEGSDSILELMRNPPSWLEPVYRGAGVLVLAPRQRCTSG